LLKLVFSRMLQGIVVLLIVSAITFSLLAAAGGDALSVMGADPLMSEKAIAELRHTYGLDQGLPVRYARWLRGMATGEMGESFYYRSSVGTVLKPRLIATVKLACVGLLFAILIAVTLGTLTARWPRGWLDRFCSLIVLLGASTPRIVIALVALALIVRTSLVSIGPAAEGGEPLTRLLLTGFVLSVPLISLFLAQAQDGLQSAMREDFIMVARAKGLSEWAIILRHAARSALNPLITLFGYSLGGLISGSVIVETVLGWPGIGQLSVTAVRSRDVPLLMGVVFVSAVAVLIGNLFADILLLVNDPRMREEGRVRHSPVGETTN
jgi:peptide/nickel transport system permease protein